MDTKEIFSRSEWIFAACGNKDEKDAYFDYKQGFTARINSKTLLYIAAHTQYAVYINGAFADCGQLHDYEHRQMYDVLDITELVNGGENELVVKQYYAGEDFSTFRKQKPGIIFSVVSGDDIVAVSSEETLSGRNNRYLSKAEKLTPQVGYNFEYDATQADTVFCHSVRAGKQKDLFPRPIEKLDICPLIKAEPVAQGIFADKKGAVTKSEKLQTAFLSAMYREELFDGEGNFSSPTDCGADGIYTVFDLGGEQAGLLSFSIEVPEKTEVLISFGEHLCDLRVRAKVGMRNFALKYIAKPGKNEFFHPFQRYGMRYIQVHIYSDKGRIDHFGLRPTNYPVSRKPIPVKDALHKKIWETAVKTLHLCMHEHYEDCPWREQAMYAMDSRVQILCGYYAFGEERFARASLRMMMDSLRPDGLLELVPPGTCPINIPCFTMIYVREIFEYTEYTGDKTLAQEIFDGLSSICDKLVASIDETGLSPLMRGEQYWNFYEWTKYLDGCERHTEKVYESLHNAFLADALRCFANICKALGKPYEKYISAYQSLCKKTHEKFYDKNSGAYITRLGDDCPRHELTQSMMLFADAVPEECVDGVQRAIMDKKLIGASLSMTIFTYDVLLENGKNRDYVLSEIQRIWGKMLTSGIDTFWETEEGSEDFSMAGSLCHGWAAVPIYIFSKYGFE